MRMRFYLKGGHSFALEFTEMDTVRNNVTGELTSVEGKYVEDHFAGKLTFINLGEVQAIVRETL